MTSGLADTLEHPLASLVAEVNGTVERYGSGPAWTLAPSALPDLLQDLLAAENALASVRLRLLREADRHQRGEAAGHTCTANWWATQSRKTRPERSSAYQSRSTRVSPSSVTSSGVMAATVAEPAEGDEFRAAVGSESGYAPRGTTQEANGGQIGLLHDRVARRLRRRS